MVKYAVIEMWIDPDIKELYGIDPDNFDIIAIKNTYKSAYRFIKTFINLYMEDYGMKLYSGEPDMEQINDEDTSFVWELRDNTATAIFKISKIKI